MGWNANHCSSFGPMARPMSSWLERIPSPRRARGPWIAIAVAKITELCCNGLVELKWPWHALRGDPVFHDIASERHIPDYKAHCVLRVFHCARNGMVSVLREHGGTLQPSAAKLVQDSVNGARKIARTARPGRWGSEKANKKGQVRIEWGAAVHFVTVRLFLPLLQKVGTMIGGHQVRGRPWVDICRDWWEAFTAMANVAWKRNFVSGHEQWVLLQQRLTMWARHLALGWSKSLWTHMWINHMFAYLCRWGTLARFNCFALEGSRVRTKRLLRNIGGVSLLHNKSRLQRVVDNHPLDDHLRKEGWKVTIMGVTKQRGYQHRCMAWSRARRERKGREALVERIVKRALRQSLSDTVGAFGANLLFSCNEMHTMPCVRGGCSNLHVPNVIYILISLVLNAKDGFFFEG